MADDASVTLHPRTGLIQYGDLGAYHGNSRRKMDRWISVLSGGCIDVKSLAVSAPPGSPADGDGYIVLATGSGAWTGHDAALAVWFADSPGVDNNTKTAKWEFMTPWKGMMVYNEADDKIYVWAGAAWDLLLSHVGP